MLGYLAAHPAVERPVADEGAAAAIVAAANPEDAAVALEECTPLRRMLLPGRPGCSDRGGSQTRPSSVLVEWA